MNNKFSNDYKINKALKIFSKQLKKDFEKTRKRVMIAVESCPKLVSFEDALKQVKKFNR